MKHLDLILTGHMHDPSNAFVRNEAGQAVVIGAGAGYETRESRNSFNIAEIDPETGRGIVQFYKYLPDHTLWKKDTDVNPNSDNGSFTFEIKLSTYLPEIPYLPDLPQEKTVAVADDKEARALRKTYLKRVLLETGELSLEGVDPKTAGDAAEKRMSLGSVYTALLTTQGKFLEDENVSILYYEKISNSYMDSEALSEALSFSRLAPQLRFPVVSALEMLSKENHLVLLGDPGSGKTTFVNFVAMCMAGELSGEKDANLSLLTNPLPKDDGNDEGERQSWDHGPLLPVRVVLRDFAAKALSKACQSEALASGAAVLWDFIANELATASLGDYAPHLHRELINEGGLILLDGLDEVPEAEDCRSQLKQVVEDFVKTFNKCRVLVTSRTYAYQKQQWRMSNMAEATLAPFSPGQIRRFADRWYAHVAVLRRMDADDAAGRATLLKQAIFNSRRLTEFAERPLLMTLMASLHAWRGGSLPERREELYADTLDLLLESWEGSKVKRDRRGEPTDREPSLSEWLKTDRDKVRRLLNRLAYEAHAKQTDTKGTADVPEADLIAGLIGLSDNPDVKPKQLVNYLSQRAGLLVPRGVGVYTFPHRTFQEYLAACWLTDADYPEKIAGLARTEPNRWREVALLAGAKAGRGSEFGIWALAGALCFRETDHKDRTEQDVWGGHLAGQLLAETLVSNSVGDANKRRHDRVRQWLVHIMTGNDLPAIERVAAGNNLSKLGDPRFNPDKWHLPDDDDLGFVTIPAGPFMMGSNKKKDKDAEDDESPQHEADLSEYRIAKYPVTVAQFNTFVKETGHGVDKQYAQYNRYDNHPVVTVSWDDAVAYSKWLTKKLGVEVRLPTEAQWGKAARGSDERIFPWGETINPNKANYNETGIGTASPVGCFPEGSSPYGLSDMGGNVWEWCADWFGGYSEDREMDPVGPEKGRDRVLRGGSWFNFGRNCRSAYRLRFTPGGRSVSFGFRLVLPAGH